MSWRRRLSRAARAVLGQGDESGSSLEAGQGSGPGAGIGRLVARALGPREGFSSEPDLEPAADDATLAALREELAAELARVSREHQRA